MPSRILRLHQPVILHQFEGTVVDTELPVGCAATLCAIGVAP